MGGSDANDVCDAAGVEVFACDFDGTTDGIGADRGGWNCLVLREDVPAWLKAAKDHEGAYAVASATGLVDLMVPVPR